MRFILDQSVRIVGFLVFERHGVNDALDIVGGAFPRRPFREIFKRAGLRHQSINEVAVHGFGHTAQSTDRDAIIGLGLSRIPERFAVKRAVAFQFVRGSIRELLLQTQPILPQDAVAGFGFREAAVELRQAKVSEFAIHKNLCQVIG